MTDAAGKPDIIDASKYCGRPKISKSGDIGWSVWTDHFAGRYHHTYELLRVRTNDGATHEIRPNGYFIMNWGFVDKDKSVVIESMQHHGPSYYIKYDISSGQLLGRVDEYKPYAELPKWAQPFADKDE